MISIRTLTLFAGMIFQAAIGFGDVISFGDLSLPPESSWNGPDPSGTPATGPYGGTGTIGSFESGGASFVNRNYEYLWNGFAYSNETDTKTANYSNEFSALTGTDHSSGDDIYGVGYGYAEIDPTNAADLMTLPYFTLPAGQSIEGMFVTNTTLAGLSMLNGDGYAKKFGGALGNDPDWFKLTAYGIDALGNPLSTAAEFYLADYRFSDNSLDYVIDEWSFFDLSPLAGARSLHFNFSSTDNGAFGMNTPAYFAMDDIQLAPTAAVPEPTSFLLMAGSFLGAGLWGRFRGRMKAKC